MTTCSRHSHRIEPIALSQYPFCHGDCGAVGRSRMLIARKAADEDVTVDGDAVTNDVSRRYFRTIGLGELVRNPFSRWVQSLPAIGFGGDRVAESATRRAVGMRSSEPQMGRSTRCRRRNCEGTSSTPGTPVAFPLPYTLQPWFV